MKEISLSQFKSAYDNIADLVVSLDIEHKAILKPRNEIVIYIDGKSVHERQIILDELIEVCNLQVISETYLEIDRNEHGHKVSLESYFKAKLKTAESEQRYIELCGDDEIVNKIATKLKRLVNKKLKINYLLKEKEKYLKGVYDHDFLEEIKKERIYLFIERELEHWGKYTEITNQYQPIKGFQNSLKPPQIEQLYTQLQNNYINTDKDHFKAIFKNEPLPPDYVPICWLKSNRLLGYFIEELAKKRFVDMETNINKAIKEYFIDKNKEPFTDSIKQNRSGSGSNKGSVSNKESKPKGHEKIDSILTNLYPPLQ